MTLDRMHRVISRLPGLRWVTALLAVAPLAMAGTASAAEIAYYDATYRATFKPGNEYAAVERELKGEKLPSKVVLRADPKRYQELPFQSAAGSGCRRKWSGTRKASSRACTMSSR